MVRKQDYSPEFREEAVKLVTEQGLTQGEAADAWRFRKGPWPTGWQPAEGYHRMRRQVVAQRWTLNRRTVGYARNWRRPAWSETS